MKLLNHTKNAAVRGASPKVNEPLRRKMVISGIEQLSLQDRQHTGKKSQLNTYGTTTSCGKPKLMVSTNTLDHHVESVVCDSMSLDQLKREFIYRYPSRKRLARGKWKAWFIFQLEKGSLCVAPISENGGGSPQASIAYTVATAPTQCTADSTLSGSSRSQLCAKVQKSAKSRPQEANAPTTTFGIVRPDLGVRRRYAGAARVLRATSHIALQNKPSESKASNKGNTPQQPSKIGTKKLQQSVKPEAVPEKEAKTTRAIKKVSIRRNRKSMPGRIQRDKSIATNTDKTNTKNMSATKTIKTESQKSSVAKKLRPEASLKRESPYKYYKSIGVNPVMRESAPVKIYNYSNTVKGIHETNQPHSASDANRKLGTPYKYREPLAVNQGVAKNVHDNASNKKTTMTDNKTVKPTVQKESATIPASYTDSVVISPYKHRLATMRRSRKSFPSKQNSISLEDHTNIEKDIPKVVQSKPVTTTRKTQANTPHLSLVTSTTENASAGQPTTSAGTTTMTTTTELLKGKGSAQWMSDMKKSRKLPRRSVG